MLILAHSLRELRFGALMEVYLQGNQEKAERDYPQEPADVGLRLAEEDFYRYLRECFFRTPGAVYAVWEEGGSYVSALRLEPYRDGVLVTALETVPQQRRKGYAFRLLGEVLVKLEYVGICGSDLEAYRGTRAPEFITTPARLGHEVSGVIDMVGEKVK